MTKWTGAGLTVTLAVWLAGCQLCVNPWRDEIAHQPAVTTGSAEYAKALDVVPEVRRRDFDETAALVADGTVTHGALYFEDPWETAGGDNDHFAWTVEDHAHIAFGTFRYLLNGAFMPVSAIDTPPWAVMESDGEPSRHVLWLPHDAARQGTSAVH